MPDSFPALQLDRHGWLRPHPYVTLLPSPNCNQRPPDDDATLLVIHNISLPPGVFGGTQVADLFLNQLDLNSHPWLPRLRGLKVSAHFFIRRDGSVIQFVSTDQRAWHAGVSSHQGRAGCNDFSIGIELEGTDTLPYTASQYLCLSQLTPALQTRHPLRAVRGHEHIAPGRKTDPGPSFDWARYARDAQWSRRQLPA
ncbi:1,6-anhydro-N-acetylmuramyl-L-alanine amidase AmpD [Alcaligenaceae bacterium]|nr:1,6-anhydro-N-acetylmuramyl-L-alanine amidase AmpD [Alcaligenaceae bacterium]